MFFFLFILAGIYWLFLLWFTIGSFRERCARTGGLGMVGALFIGGTLGFYAWSYQSGYLSSFAAQAIQFIFGVGLPLFTALLFIPLGRNPKARLGTKGMAVGASEKFNQKDTAFSVAHVGGYGPEAARNRWALQSYDPFGGIFWTLVMGLRYQVDGKVSPQKREGFSPEEITAEIKEKARYLGADLVGITGQKRIYLQRWLFL
jgi:hypothetical protein